MSGSRREGVELPEGTSGSALLYGVLSKAADQHPSVFGGSELLGDPRRFRSGFAERLVQFELRRIASSQRVRIAREMLVQAQEMLRFCGPAGEAPLAEHLSRPAEPLALEELRLLGAGRLTPRAEHQGRSYVGRQLADVADLLLERAHCSRAAHSALRGLSESFAEEQIDLSGRRFVILGAGAELSPVPLLLEAGADVLWLDVVAPPEGLVKDSQLSGRLFFPPGGADIMRRPAEIAASIEAFAQPAAVHVGLYAYAAGRSREWRIAAAMNAIVRSLPQGAVESLSLFVSPTSPAAVQQEDIEAAQRRLADAPFWQKLLRGAGQLPDGHDVADAAAVARAVVPIQGASYQAAQYLAKTLAAEVWGTLGNDLNADGPALRVSANSAAITRTRSLSTPIFEAGFVGAPAFGVDTFAPETTRALRAGALHHCRRGDRLRAPPGTAPRSRATLSSRNPSEEGSRAPWQRKQSTS
jgi:hypothetical protein